MKGLVHMACGERWVATKVDEWLIKGDGWLRREMGGSLRETVGQEGSWIANKGEGWLSW